MSRAYLLKKTSFLLDFIGTVIIPWTELLQFTADTERSADLSKRFFFLYQINL